MTRALALTALALAACTDGSGAPHGHVAGHATYAGRPLAGATVRAWQLLDGERTLAAGETTTGPDGAWSLDVGDRFADLAVEAAGGVAIEAGGAEVALADDVRLRGLVLDLPTAGVRDDVTIDPWSELVVALGEARAALGKDGGDRHRAWRRAAALLGAHLGFDPLAGPVASLDEPAPSPRPPERHALALAGLSTLAAAIADEGGVAPADLHTATLVRALVDDLARDGLFEGDGDTRIVGTAATCHLPAGCAARGDGCRQSCHLYHGTLRLRLALAIRAFLRSPGNRTGIDEPEVTTWIEGIRASTERELWGDAAPPPFDMVPPVVMFAAPTPPEGAWVRGAIELRAEAMDDADGVPAVTWDGGLVDRDGDPTNAVAQAAIDTAGLGGADGPATLAITARAIDDDGNTGAATRTVRVDNHAPALAVDDAGFLVDEAGDWWLRPPLATGPTLTGTAADAAGVTVTARAGTTVLATAALRGERWSLALPPGTIADEAGAAIAIVAADPAGNTTSRIVRLRLDATPPALAFEPTAVRDERGDAIAFATAPDPSLGGVPGYDPTHNHLAAPAIALGTTPAPACTVAAAPTVGKHAYLLDDATPPHVIESGDGAGGRNPIAFRVALTDRGVGLDLAHTAFRVRDGSGAIALDWTPLADGAPILDGGVAIGRTHAIALHRAAATGPAIAALAAGGLFQLEVRGRDRLGREVTDARCWNLVVLPSPIVAGDASLARQAESGPPGSGKLGLRALSLADVAPPYDPIGAALLEDGAAGVGLVELPLWNPTPTAVHVAIDLAAPAASYSRELTLGYWARSSTALADLDCGYVAATDGPDYTRPGCARYSGFPAPTTTSMTDAAATAGFTVRVFEEVSASVAVELPPCASCTGAVPAPAAGSVRVVVSLPPRVPGAPPRKFWVVAAVTDLQDELRPGGAPPYTEHTAAGLVLTGTYDQATTLCTAFQFQGASYHCVQRATYRRYRALTRAGFALPFAPLVLTLRTSQDGATLHAPAYLAPGTRAIAFAGWSTAEPSLPLPPPGP